MPISSEEFEAGKNPQKRNLSEVMKTDVAYTTKVHQGTILSCVTFSPVLSLMHGHGSSNRIGSVIQHRPQSPFGSGERGNCRDQKGWSQHLLAAKIRIGWPMQPSAEHSSQTIADQSPLAPESVEPVHESKRRRRR